MLQYVKDLHQYKFIFPIQLAGGGGEGGEGGGGGLGQTGLHPSTSRHKLGSIYAQSTCLRTQNTGVLYIISQKLKSQTSAPSHALEDTVPMQFDGGIGGGNGGGGNGGGEGGDGGGGKGGGGLGDGGGE